MEIITIYVSNGKGSITPRYNSVETFYSEQQNCDQTIEHQF